MRVDLAKSVYLGLAALSLGAVTSVSTTASAKSKAYVVSNSTMTSDPTTRNVELTGSNAIYTKPGTAAGARVVASKYTAGNWANSKSSADYFRAYRVVTTNRGSVYYKVVSMSGHYRGYIYGGNSTSTFAGGVQPAKTMTAADLPTSKTATFANPGTKNVTWAAPKYTQYKSTKMVKSTTPYAKDTLTITKAATKTREGWLYYYVEDAQNPQVNGWIFSDALKVSDKDAIDPQNGITLKFVNKATGEAVSNKVVALPKGTTTSVTNYQAIQLANANLPVGYTYSGLGTSVTVSKGGSVVVYLIQNPATTLNLQAKVYNNDVNDQSNLQNLLTTNWHTAKVQDVLKKDAFFNQADGKSVKGSEIVKQLKTDKLASFTVPLPTANGTTAYKYDLVTAQDAVFGMKNTTTNVYYQATEGTLNNGVFQAY